MCLIGVFPGIVAFRVSFPFDEILEFSCHRPWGSI
jgi:hypothetical protein